jgi:DNA-binding response OmpR family regulator
MYRQFAGGKSAGGPRGAATGRRVATGSSAGRAEPVPGARVLVAEDDPVTARFLHSLLADKGYDVMVAEDGERAMELALRFRPHLIISDLVMPYKDGFGVLHAVRAEQRLSNVPLLILSMRDREEDIVRGLEDGADDYVIKPFNARELMARVRKLLERGLLE